jgi:Zn-dependent metalloprotease
MIYNGTSVLLVPNPFNWGIFILENGEPVGKALWAPFLVTDNARAANLNLQRTRDYFKEMFGRESWDGQGAAIRATVDIHRFHIISLGGFRQNAAWMPDLKIFMFGAGGDELGGFAEALDCVAHEFTHAIAFSETELTYAGWSGALHEHLADAFGAIIEHTYQPEGKPFLIGENILRGAALQKAQALRDMEYPSKGLVPQPEHMKDVPEEYLHCEPSLLNDNCGVHLLNGVLNKAFVAIVKDIGWEASARLYYDVITNRLTPEMDFAGFGDVVIDSCGAMLTGDAAISSCDGVIKAFESVGL